MSLGDPLYTYLRDIEPIDLRQVWEAFAEGVLDDGLEVTAGASGLTVDVAAGVGFVQGDDVADQGRYRAFNDAPSSSATWGAPIPAAHATNPRLDLVVLRIYDDFVDSSGDYSAAFEIIPGTATSGATLGNRNGAAALPDTALHLADVLVPAAATSIASGDIADQRTNAAPDTTSLAADLAAHEAETRASDPHGIDTELDAIDATLAGKQDTAEKGAAGGYASLDGGGKVPMGQLPAAIMTYQGTWDASTNTPTLADGTGDIGDLYRVSVAGSQDLGSGSLDFEVGDYVIYNGSTWERSDTTDAVASVNGYTGVVVLDAADVGAGDVTETKGAVIHGAVAGTARPADFPSVEWIGSVEPSNATDNDTWVEVA